MRSRLWVPVLALFLVAATCSPDSFELVRVQRDDVEVLPGADGFVHPLTGVTYYTPQAWQQRPALSVKIGNTPPERPPSGIHQADLIYEELIEAGATRLLVVFLSDAPDRLGPVRSVRRIDAAILAPIGGLFGNSGGTPPIVSHVRTNGNITDLGHTSNGADYRRDGARNAPYNLYTSVPDLREGQAGEPPQALFSWLDLGAEAGGGDPADTAEMRFSNGGTLIGYRYDADSGTYQRFQNDEPHVTEAPEGEEAPHLAFTNVVVQRVSVSAGGTVDQGGNRTSNANLMGSGDVTILRGGRAFTGTWKRDAMDEPTRFVDADDEPILLAPGKTVVELLPSGRALDVS